MDTNAMTQEKISALADGELPGEHIDIVLAALRNKEGKADWDIYHQIGDVLRSDDMAVDLSPGFSSRLSARLDAEPTIMAPALASSGESTGAASGARMRRWALPSMAAATAMATVAFFTTPQLMVALKNDATAPAVQMASGTDGSVVTASAPDGVVLRDPRIDDYLMAHQRISPSVYSTAQFARSANFATDSNK
ncbi:sigma-E factor negative regulatory protein [Noviherbaspirillum sp. ST9]|uniref:sigma-E factor negative regulatory protein n=1 Tax=Noviherbaspirillum sp. ST9 TaxID=3401606 RepID=UPI003B5868F7